MEGATITSTILKNDGGKYDAFIAALKGLKEEDMKAITELLAAKAPHTVFIPTNEAFANAKSEIMKIMKKMNCADTNELEMKKKEWMANLLKAHVAAGSFTKTDLNRGGSIKTITGEMLCVFTVKQETTPYVFFNNIKTHLVGDSKSVSNGRIYMVSEVIWPLMSCAPLTKTSSMGSME
jgi:uncharacterized surface protein with fasciclin (FAS1) repeats